MKKISILQVCLLVFLMTVGNNTNAAIRSTWPDVNETAIMAQGKSVQLLPVVLTPLIGNYFNGFSQLQWSSLQESNSNRYEIQRSIDGTNFVKVGDVKAKGSSDLEVVYNYKDVSAAPGINYYRLKLIDNDGVFQYSNIEAITATVRGIKITGNYPGPFTEEVNVNILSAWVSPAVISLLDGNGKVLMSRQIKLVKGANKTSFNNLGYLNSGIYYIKIQTGTTSATEKIIK